MLAAYKQSPQHYLTVTACRRNLAGDVGAILRCVAIFFAAYSGFLCIPLKFATLIGFMPFWSTGDLSITSFLPT